ncbi:hypothetical protein [Mycobacterium sp. SMC-13]|uniref:hypothetical protein n=1 Tax=Mycobacterium sp. SMC-13 TaxID=3381626 RepID=UPI00387687F5
MTQTIMGNALKQKRPISSQQRVHHLRTKRSPGPSQYRLGVAQRFIGGHQIPCSRNDHVTISRDSFYLRRTHSVTLGDRRRQRRPKLPIDRRPPSNLIESLLFDQ